MDPNAPNNQAGLPGQQPVAPQPQPVPQPVVNSDPMVVQAPAVAVPQPAITPPQPVAPQPVVAQPQVAPPVVAPIQPAIQAQPAAQMPQVGAPMQQVQAAPTMPLQPAMQPQPGVPLQPVGGPSAAPPGLQAPPNKVLKLGTIIFTVIAILVCSYGTLHVFQVRKNKYGFAADADKARKEQVKKAVENSKPDTEKRTDGKLNLTKLFDTEKSQHDQDIKAELNEQVNIANGFSFMVTSVEGNWKKSGDYETPPAPGKEFIKVGVVIGSRAEKGTMSFYSSKLELLNTKGGKQTEVYVDSDDIPNNGLDASSSINLNPGDQRSGWIVYEVDKGESPISLVYEQKGFSCASNDNKDCLMKGTVKLQ